MATGNGGTSVGSIFLSLLLDDSSLNSQIRRSTNSAGSVLSSSLNGIFTKVLATAATAFSVNAIKEFGNAAIDVAANIGEVQNVVDTAFEDMAYKCEEFADIAIDSFGISELSAKKTASTYMAMSKGMGLAAESASNMSINVAKMAADVASFYNLDYNLSSTKLKAIWTGETEGLKDLGIVMTQTNLQAYALSLGIEKNIQDMSQADQTTLRYKYVMEQLKLAQGDFAKTSESWSNQTRILSESWTQFQGKIGTILIDVLNPFLECVTQIVDKMNSWADVMQEKFGLKEAEENIKASTAAISDAIVGDTEEAVEKANEAMLGLASFDQIYKLGSSSSSESTESVFGGTIEDAYESAVKEEKQRETLIDKFIKFARGQFTKYQGFILPIWASVKNAGSEAWETIQVIGGDALKSLKDFWNKHGEQIFVYLTKFTTKFYDGMAKIYDSAEKAWNSGFGELFRSMVDLLGSALDLFFAIYDVVEGPLTTIFNTFFDHAGELIGDLAEDLSEIVDIITAITGFFTNAVNGEFKQEALTNLNTAITNVSPKEALKFNSYLMGPSGTLFSAISDILPEFANGGIVSAPTIGLMGEYSNAKSNPEVISPLSDLKGMIAEVVAETMAAMGDGQTHLTVNLGPKTIIDEVVKGINKQTKRRNREVVVTTN